MMKKKRNGQTEPLLEALRPLDQINPLPPALSPAQLSSRLRLQTPQPAKRRYLTLRHVAAAAAVLAIVIGAPSLPEPCGLKQPRKVSPFLNKILSPGRKVIVFNLSIV